MQGLDCMLEEAEAGCWHSQAGVQLADPELWVLSLPVDKAYMVADAAASQANWACKCQQPALMILTFFVSPLCRAACAVTRQGLDGG